MLTKLYNFLFTLHLALKNVEFFIELQIKKRKVTGKLTVLNLNMRSPFTGPVAPVLTVQCISNKRLRMTSHCFQFALLIVLQDSHVNWMRLIMFQFMSVYFPSDKKCVF